MYDTIALKYLLFRRSGALFQWAVRSPTHLCTSVYKSLYYQSQELFSFKSLSKHPESHRNKCKLICGLCTTDLIYGHYLTTSQTSLISADYEPDQLYSLFTPWTPFEWWSVITMSSEWLFEPNWFMISPPLCCFLRTGFPFLKLQVWSICLENMYKIQIPFAVFVNCK